MDTTSLNASGTELADAPRWSRARVEALYALPFNDLIYRAQAVHRDPSHGRLCYDDWLPDGRVEICPTTLTRPGR